MGRFRSSIVSFCAFLFLAVVVTCDGSIPICGDPLFLTPFIKAGNVIKARNESRAIPLKGNIVSYSGFFTVNERYDSNIFFWYFPAERSPSTAPVLLWLQGGPGTPGLSGLFNEHGPFYVKLHRGLKQRKYYWSQIAHVIYIDSPVGTGFSFTNSTAGNARNARDVASDLYEALLQFFSVFIEIRPNDFHVMGESYGAKYALELASLIDVKNTQALLKINLKGIALQNGFWDPENMLRYSDYLYQIGLIDSVGSARMKVREDNAVSFIQAGRFLEALQVYDETIGGRLTQWNTAFQNMTSYDSYNNFLHPNGIVPYGSYSKYLTKELVRKFIHVGNLTFNVGYIKVQGFQVEDIMTSEKRTVEALLEKYRVLLYNGQLDVIVAYPLTVNAIGKLKWSGALQYEKQRRDLWIVDGDVAGYSKSVKGFTELLVRNAGHKVAYDQPRWALDIIKRFVSGKT